jgi:hypothetical protein
VLGAAYEILGDAAHPQFRAVLGVVKTLQAPLTLPNRRRRWISTNNSAPRSVKSRTT